MRGSKRMEAGRSLLGIFKIYESRKRRDTQRECCVVGEGETISLSFVEFMKCSLVLHLNFVFCEGFLVITPLSSLSTTNIRCRQLSVAQNMQTGGVKQEERQVHSYYLIH